MKTAKSKVLKIYPNAYCVKLYTNNGFIVWTGKIMPRGFEQPAIGVAGTARAAWSLALRTITKRQ